MTEAICTAIAQLSANSVSSNLFTLKTHCSPLSITVHLNYTSIYGESSSKTNLTRIRIVPYPGLNCTYMY